jgi:hypothetical protein
MGTEEIRKAAGEEFPSGESAPEWSGDDLDEVAVAREPRAEERIIGMSEGEMRKAGMIFAIIILLFTASGIFLSDVASEIIPFDLANCIHIARNAERLSCYDRAVMGAGVPFKGASPFSTYSRSDLTSG